MRTVVRALVGSGFWADFVAGATLAAFVAAVVPGLRQHGRPLAVAAVADFLDVSDAVRAAAARLKEDVTDLVVEAQFSRLAQRLEHTPALPAGDKGPS